MKLNLHRFDRGIAQLLSGDMRRIARVVSALAPEVDDQQRDTPPAAITPIRMNRAELERLCEQARIDEKETHE